MRTTAWFSILIALATIAFACSNAAAQGEKTIVLVRHVEKDVSPAADKVDPELSPEGRARAERLMHAIKKYKPAEIYSTKYKRSRGTAEPMANRRHVEIKTYDAGRQDELIQQIAASKKRRFFVVGHSNTIPLLANLLIKKEIFRPLLESEYGVFWVIRIKNGAVIRVETFPY